jgi:hypothetical protein
MRRSLLLSFLALAAAAAFARSPQSSELYPNELPHFKFYARYLSPLRPYISDRTAVVSVLGPDERIEAGYWRIQSFFVGKGKDSTVKPEFVDRLANVTLRPKQRVSMAGVQFPAAFDHSFGGVSESNVSCDVYRDSFGLQYWIYSKDSQVGKKGDLMQIEYGPDKETERQANGQPRSLR